jgi:hypothetical protein
MSEYIAVNQAFGDIIVTKRILESWSVELFLVGWYDIDIPFKQIESALVFSLGPIALTIAQAVAGKTAKTI